ncbi:MULTISPECIES: hypothetical protein [Streptomyces]|uniref:hypothetical protein n=1 Tax=Streptomyces TaxID=1883 RepID=UPI0004CDDA18|nr:MULTISPECIES: hypothetical protein [Streptomyces]
MENTYDDYCKIFVSSQTTSTVVELLEEATGGTFERKTANLSTLTMDVLQNPDRKLESGDFVTWPVLIELEKETQATWEDYVAKISEILTYLWEHRTPAVASCDFEALLPWNGGIEKWPAENRF